MNLRLPNLVIGGAQKSGTTSLHRILQSHPSIFIPPRPAPQEIHFFDLDENYARGVEWYGRFFSGARDEPWVGQTSPLYLYDTRVPERLTETLPGVKLIFILRHPVDRAYSHYWHEVRFGWEMESFERALELEPLRIEQGRIAQRHYSYSDRGYYATQVERFARFIPEEQMLVLQTERLRRDPENFLAALGRFLDVSPEGFNRLVAGESHNRSHVPRYRALQRMVRPLRRSAPAIAWLVDRINLRRTRYPRMAAATRSMLLDRYVDDWKVLGERWGIDLELWRAIDDKHRDDLTVGDDRAVGGQPNGG